MRAATRERMISIMALVAELQIHGLIDVEEAFIDGSFVPSKKGAPRSPRLLRETRGGSLDVCRAGSDKPFCRHLDARLSLYRVRPSGRLTSTTFNELRSSGQN